MAVWFGKERLATCCPGWCTFARRRHKYLARCGRVGSWNTRSSFGLAWLRPERHQLKRQLNLRAETDLEAGHSGFPDAFGGGLLSIEPGALYEIQTNDFVEVGFKGKRYKFTRLEGDGISEVRKGW